MKTLDKHQLFLIKALRRDKRQTSLKKHFLSCWALAQSRDQNLGIYDSNQTVVAFVRHAK